MKELPLLTLLIFIPLAGALVLALVRQLSPPIARAIALVASLSTLVLGLVALNEIGPVGVQQLVERHSWIPTLAVFYHLGLDQLSLLLVLLTGLIAPVSLLAAARDPKIEPRQVRAFSAWFLVLQASALGVFLAQDFVLWFLFWELSIVPVFFLVKLWGGSDRTRAAFQFMLYTLVGSAALLLGFVVLFSASGTFQFPELARRAAEANLTHGLSPAVASLAFFGVLLGVAVKAPLFPFHGWQAPLYAEAPTSVSMFLTAVVSKLGVYGFVRLLWPLFPDHMAQYATPLLWLALGGVVLGALSAMAQKDLKRMIAYSSLNHVSYCLLALFAVGQRELTPRAADMAPSALLGLLLQVFNHGISAAALFYFVGCLERRAGGRRGLNDFGGARTAAPILAGLCGIALFSSLGLPGLNGFVGEFLILRGVFGTAPWATAVATIGLLVTAIFLLTFFQRVFCGPRAGGSATAEFRDLDRREVGLIAPLIALMFIFGVAPHLLANWLTPLVHHWEQARWIVR